MLNINKLKRRDLYLNKLIAFKDTDIVKVITGIRRCGKSSLLKLMALHLKEQGIDDNQIIEMNFESYNFKDMTADSLYDYVKARILPKKRMYLFFDEIQRVPKWEDAINAFRVDFDADIYVTGSNAYMLSSEYTTLLAGRCIEIKVLPLSFSEFLTFYGFKITQIKDALGNFRKIAQDSQNLTYEITDIFNSYLRFGGMPGIIDVGLDQEKALVLLEGIYSTVIIRDILERENIKGEKKLSDPLLLRKIIMFLADNVGSNISLSNIGNTLINEGLLKNGKKSSPSTHTIGSYVDNLLKAYFFYEIKRFDIKGKELLRTLGKYYIVDIGLRNFILGFRNQDRGHTLENIVYFELKRRGFDVAIGKIDNLEIDFIATNMDNKLYIQVTESIVNEDVKNRELLPLIKIKDNYPKIVLSLDNVNNIAKTSFEGIEIINLIDWLI